MAIQETQHGLSILTTSNANRRLVRPVPANWSISTTFNDASSGGYYPNNEGYGHEGIDFACPAGTPIKPMFPGKVVEGTAGSYTQYHKNRSKDGEYSAYGVWVKIESKTDTGTFRHVYAHLAHPMHLLKDPDKWNHIPALTELNHPSDFAENPSYKRPFTEAEYEASLKVLRVTANGGREVDTNTVLGVSYDTGSLNEYHLHVHLRPFNTKTESRESREFRPVAGTPTHYAGTKLAELILGCVNFVYFLPPDDALPAITKAMPLLSARDAFACIDVYSMPSKDGEKFGTINGSRLGYYGITGMHKSDPNQEYPDWWQIQWTEHEKGWVPIWGPIGTTKDCPNTEHKPEGDMVWVQTFGDVHRVPVAWPPAPSDLRAVIRGSAVEVSWIPSRTPEGVPDHLKVTGYRIWRYQQGTGIFGGVSNTVTQRLSLHELKSRDGRVIWTDHPQTSLAELGLLYRVAALTDDTVGAATALHSAWLAPTLTMTPPPPDTPPVPPQPAPPVDTTAPPTAVPVTSESSLETVTGPGNDAKVSGFTLLRNTFYDAVGYFRDFVLGDNEQREEWLRLRKADTDAGGNSGPQAAGDAAGQATAQVCGWVPLKAVRGGEDWKRQAQSLPKPPFVRVAGTGTVPVRVGPATGYTEYLTQIDRDDDWQAVLGRNGSWWQVQADATRKGWVPAALVDETGDASDVPVVNESPPPVPAGPGGTDAPSTTATQASGHYLNLANSWEGAWSVSKSGTTVTAAFQSSRSPVQYLARQNPADLLVLPAGFRPTTNRDIEVTGVHVTKTGVDYAGEPKQTFKLRVSTTGAVRYKDGSELDHVGFLRYEVGTTASGTTITWTTATAATPGTRPSLPDLSGSGTYYNQQVNWGSRWEMEREGDEVEGSFTTTRSPVEYFANQNREAQVWLPREYWPEDDERFQVKGAVRVNEDGTDSTDTRKVDFWITVRSSDGRMYYDRDASLETQGVGYLRYSVDVDWDAAPRVQVPTAPRELEVDSVTATEVELDWRSPEDNGGDSVDEYKVERYRNGRWRTEEDDISRTRYEVEDLSPHTRYSFRVAARNSAGWGPASTTVTATTRRAKPGRPRSLTATASHDRVTLDWTAPSSGAAVTGYRVSRRVGRGPYAVVVADTGSAVSFHVDWDVTAATSYSYRVRALHHGEEGNWSSARTVTTAAAPTIPGSPTALSVVPGTASQLRLAWTAPGDTGGGVTGYRVERSPDATPKVWRVVEADTGSAATTWDEGETLAADRDYHYRVRACNSAGASAASAEAVGHTRPRLRLDRPVRYPLTARAEPRADAAATATFPSLLPERTYDMTGRAGDADGWQRILSFHTSRSEPLWVPMAAGSVQGASADLSRVPGAPAGFTATAAANNRVMLTWRAPATGTAVSGYRLWRQQDAGSWARLGTDLAATATTYTDSTVTVGHAYRYRLQALSAEGAGVPSPIRALAVMATAAAPETVRNLQATAAATSLQLSWQKAATGGLPAAYRVAWQASTATEAETVTVAGTGHALTDLRPGTAYTLTVAAGNQEGEAAVASRTVSTLDAAPGTPTAVSVAVAGNGATAAWQAPVAGGYATSYEVQGKARTVAWPTGTVSRTVRNHALSDLTFAADHDLRVRAVNTVGHSAWVAVPFTSGPERPGTVRNPAVVPGADSQLQLTWQVPADHSVVTGHRIERSADVAPRVWTEVVADTGSTDTVWSDSGLAAATTYHYRVTARSAAGPGTVSEEISGTTRPQASLKATTAYPLKAYADPQTTAPVTHTWAAHDAAVKLDVAGRVGGSEGWWRVLRFGESAGGPYWLPAAAVTVTGATTDVPEAPGLPAALAATATHNRVTLTWTAPATGGTVIGYRIWRQTGTGTTAVAGADLAADVLTHVDRTVAGSTTYAYRVQALSAAGGGPRTAAVAVTTQPTPEAPEAPTALIVTPGSDSRLQLSWTAPNATGTHALAGYLVERSPDVEPRTWFALSEYINTTETRWVENDLAADTVYHYRVRAVSAAGGGAPSAAVQARTRPQLVLKADADYPLEARAWPATEAPVNHTWTAHDDTVSLDIVGRVAGAEGWYRVLRFGESADGPYWLPAAAVTVAGNTADLPQAPGIPGTPTATATHERATLTWTAPATGGTVTGYRLWRQTGEADFAVLGDDLAAGALMYADTGLTAETTYRYRLQALSAAGAGPRTAAVALTTAARPPVPGIPTNLTATPDTDSQMVLGWTAPTTGGTVAGYRIERAVAAEPLVWTEAVADTGSTATTWSDSGLAADTVYHYRVTGRNAGGLGTSSAAVRGRTRPQAALKTDAGYPLTTHRWPAAEAPTTHTWAAHDAQVVLDIAAQGAGGGGWYRVLRFGESADGPYWLPADTVTVTGSTADLSQAPGTSGTPTATATDESVTLTWTAPADGGTVTGYRLWRRSGGETAFTVLGMDLAATVLTHTDTAVATGTAYAYRVQALSATGAGPRSAAVTVTAVTTRVPGMPTGLTAAPAADHRMQLTWTAPADAGLPSLHGYRIERSADVTPRVWTVVAADTGSKATTWSDSGLAADTVYHYRVTARNTAGPGSSSAEVQGRTRPQAALKVGATYPLTAHRWPAAEAPVTHTWTEHDDTVSLDIAAQGAGGDGWYRVLRFGESTDGPYWLPADTVTVTGSTADLPQAPGTPSTPTATATDKSATLTWTAPADGGTVTGYRLWRRSGAATSFSVLGEDLAATVLTHTDTTVATGTAYDYRVQALAAAGAGPRTAAVTVTAVTPRVPGTPTALTAAPAADHQMQLTWTAPVDAGLPSLHGYRIERSADVTPRVWKVVTADTGTTATTWADADLVADTVYHYRVTARNTAGPGIPSAETQGRTRSQGLLSPQLGTYPLTAHAWPEATAPVTHTWQASDVPAVHDLVARYRGGGHWFRLLRFGHADGGPYWVPALALATAGAAPLPEAPEAPRQLKALAVTYRSVLLQWQAPRSGGTVTGYRLWRRTGATGPFTRLGTDLAATVRQHADDTVRDATIYHYRVQALAAVAGAGPGTEALRVPVPANPYALATPRGLQGLQTGAGTLQLRWTAVAGATGYDLRVWQSWTDPATNITYTRWVQLAASGTTSLQTGPDTRVPLTLTRTATLATVAGWPAAYAPWLVAVRATGPAGTSAWTDSLVVQPGAGPYRSPAPGGLTATGSATGAVTLTWTAVAGATAYVVAHDFPADATGKGGWHSLPHRGATLTQTGTTATVTGLAPAAAATARFRVQARNAAGLSLPSLPVTVTSANS